MNEGEEVSPGSSLSVKTLKKICILESIVRVFTSICDVFVFVCVFWGKCSEMSCGTEGKTHSAWFGFE